MSEAFGIIAGSVGVAAAFNNCVTSFEYIQLARNFGRDFGTCQLKLDIAQRRLVEWGETVDIANNPILSAGSSDPKCREAGEILDSILDHMKSAYLKAKRYQGKLSSEEREVMRPDDMSPVFRRMHNSFSARAARYQTNTILIKKFTWALYDKNRLVSLLREIKDLIEELENLSIEPIGNARSNLIRAELEEINDEPSLLALQDAAADTDEMLSKAARDKIKILAGNNTVKDIKSGGQANILVGSSWNDEALSSTVGFDDRSKNSAGSIEATGSSIVQVGNRFGGKRIS